MPMGAVPMRLDRNAEPVVAVAAAAREMLTGMSPSSGRGPRASDGTPPSTIGRPPLRSPLNLETLDERSPAHERASASTRETGDIDTLTQRLHQQERAVEEIRQLQMSLQGEVDGFLVEHRVSHSLAGLERRSRSPQVFRTASAQELHSGRRAYSMDSIRITGWN